MIPGLNQYDRINSDQLEADMGEKIGNAGLGLLRLAMGKTFTVTNESGQASELMFKETSRPLIARVAAAALAILILPITLLLTAIGYAGIFHSKSYSVLCAKHVEQNEKKEEVPPPKQEESESLEREEIAVEAPPEFSRKHARAMNLDFTTVHGKSMLQAALDHLQKDPSMASLFEAWRIMEGQKNGEKSLLDAMADCIKGGTCYGQAMNILELLDSKKRADISEEYLAANMNWKSYVTYQIIHVLHVFLTNQNSAYVAGRNIKGAKERIEAMFPHHTKKGHSSEKLRLRTLDEDALVGHLSDFVRMHIRPWNAKSEDRHNYAVQMTLRGADGGHAAIMYYSESQKRYFWYDPYKPDYGLFSSPDSSKFFRGVAAKLMEYKGSNFENFHFTAYKLD